MVKQLPIYTQLKKETRGELSYTYIVFECSIERFISVKQLILNQQFQIVLDPSQ